MTGIYKIENLITHEKYIGQSRQIEKRMQQHKYTAYNEQDHSYNNPLYRSIRKYGLENFNFSIIEECSIEKLNEREIYWIQYYDSFFHGYNLTLGGDGSGTQINKEKIIGIISDLENTYMSHADIAKKWDMSTEMVQGINTGRYWKQDRKYPIQNPKAQFIRRGFTPKDKSQHFCIDCGKPISKNAIRCLECENKHRVGDKPVSREELKALIRTEPFTKIGEKFNVTDNAVRKWCDYYNLPRKKKDINQYSDKEWELL